MEMLKQARHDVVLGKSEQLLFDSDREEPVYYGVQGTEAIEGSDPIGSLPPVAFVPSYIVRPE